MIPEHIKFKCNSSFKFIKKLYQNITVDCIDHIVKIVKKSSKVRLNKAQYYKNGKGFQYLNPNSILGIFFKKLSNLQKYQYFLFKTANPEIIKVQNNC